MQTLKSLLIFFVLIPFCFSVETKPPQPPAPEKALKSDNSRKSPETDKKDTVNKVMLFSEFNTKMNEALKVDNTDEIRKLCSKYTAYHEEFIFQKIDDFLLKDPTAFDQSDKAKVIEQLIAQYNINHGDPYFQDLWTQYKSWSSEDYEKKQEAEEKFKQISNEKDNRALLEECLSLYRNINDIRGLYKTQLQIFKNRMYKNEISDLEQASREMDSIAAEFGKPSDVREINTLKAINYLSKGELQKSFYELEKAEKSFFDYGDYINSARIQLQKGELYSKTGYFEEATEQFKKALDVFKTSGLGEEHASISNSLGNLSLRQNNVEAAEKYFTDAISIYERIQHFEGQSKVCNNLGVVYERQNKKNEAEASYNKSMELAKTANNIFQQAETANNLASLFLKNKETDKAILYYQDAIKFSRQCGAREVEIKALHNMGLAYYFSAQKENAISSLSESLSYSRRNNQDSDALETSYILGKIFMEEKNPSKAKTFFSISLELSKKLKYAERTQELEKLLKSAQ